MTPVLILVKKEFSSGLRLALDLHFLHAARWDKPPFVVEGDAETTNDFIHAESRSAAVARQMEIFAEGYKSACRHWAPDNLPVDFLRRDRENAASK